jgi:hypothetical protein
MCFERHLAELLKCLCFRSTEDEFAQPRLRDGAASMNVSKALTLLALLPTMFCHLATKACCITNHGSILLLVFSLCRPKHINKCILKSTSRPHLTDEFRMAWYYLSAVCALI